MNSSVLLLPFIISALFLPLIIFVNAQPPSYDECSPQVCGNSTIQYPFGDCGLLYARCENNQTIQLTLTDYHYWNVVGDIPPYRSPTNHSGTLQITSSDYTADTGNFIATYHWLIMGSFFNLSHGYQMATIFNCVQLLPFQRVDCIKFKGPYCYFYPETNVTVEGCIVYTTIIPASKSYNISAGNNFELALQRGFQISWSIPQDCHSCQATGGRCISYFYYNDFLDDDKNYGDYCACHDGTYHFTNCSDGREIDSNIIYTNQLGDRERNSPPKRSPPPKKASPKPMVGKAPRKKISTKYMAGKSLI